MSEWITDRAPTKEDADKNGIVWVTSENYHVLSRPWECVTEGTPWMPITRPEPYVKPKRWVAERSTLHCWRVRDTRTELLLNLAMFAEEQARKFETFLNEVMP